MGLSSKAGIELAESMLRYLPGADRAVVVDACTRLVPLARRYSNLQEHGCNRGLTGAERRVETELERQIIAIVATMPASADGPLTARFQGDPRGCTVKLHIPGQPQAGNTWGLGGDYGVDL